jgi:hypothetical protein
MQRAQTDEQGYKNRYYRVLGQYVSNKKQRQKVKTPTSLGGLGAILYGMNF